MLVLITGYSYVRCHCWRNMGGENKTLLCVSLAISCGSIIILKYEHKQKSVEKNIGSWDILREICWMRSFVHLANGSPWNGSHVPPPPVSYQASNMERDTEFMYPLWRRKRKAKHNEHTHFCLLTGTGLPMKIVYTCRSTGFVFWSTGSAVGHVIPTLHACSRVLGSSTPRPVSVRKLRLLPAWLPLHSEVTAWLYGQGSLGNPCWIINF